MSVHFMIIICFVWAGFMMAISFMESWLKFRAPGVQLAIGLSIGRLIFKALNRVEWAFFILLIFCRFLSGMTLEGSTFLWIIAIILAIILIIQSAWLLPVMDQRATLFINGEKPPPSTLHIYYVAMELVKLALLAYAGIGLFRYIV